MLFLEEYMVLYYRVDFCLKIVWKKNPLSLNQISSTDTYQRFRHIFLIDYIFLYFRYIFINKQYNTQLNFSNLIQFYVYTKKDKKKSVIKNTEIGDTTFHNCQNSRNMNIKNFTKYLISTFLFLILFISDMYFKILLFKHCKS